MPSTRYLGKYFASPSTRKWRAQSCSENIWSPTKQWLKGRDRVTQLSSSWSTQTPQLRVAQPVSIFCGSWGTRKFLTVSSNSHEDLPSRFWTISLICPIHATCPAYLIPLDSVILILFSKDHFIFPCLGCAAMSFRDPWTLWPTETKSTKFSSGSNFTERPNQMEAEQDELWAMLHYVNCHKAKCYVIRDVQL